MREKEERLRLSARQDARVGSGPIGSARTAFAEHPAVASVPDEASAGQLRARVAAPGDESRTAELAVLFAHLPRE